MLRAKLSASASFNRRPNPAPCAERGSSIAATGAIDPARIGITGLSDGASTVEFALVNSRRFAAAAMSTCCDDRLTSLVLGGWAWGDENHRTGYPLSVDDDRAYWKPISLSLNARSIATPILFQVADREAGLSLESYGALREAGKPVEMYVYPDEFHNKVQPRHRLAVYDRNIDWFAYWLRSYEDPAPDKRAQYERWGQLRAAQQGCNRD
jgi:dipeptidyl aminopeptidase/acylaminoacyl peptidase